MKKSEQKEHAVMITTAYRGVFFGYTSDDIHEILARGTAQLARARMCTYWSAETHGALGLAARGPAKGSKIGPQVPTMACNAVTGVFACSKDAVQAWEAEPWAR